MIKQCNISLHSLWASIPLTKQCFKFILRELLAENTKHPLINRAITTLIQREILHRKFPSFPKRCFFPVSSGLEKEKRFSWLGKSERLFALF